jgi:hypothetical protein
MRKLKLFTVLALVTFLIYGWGATGHKIINRKSVYSFPGIMSPFSWWRDSLAAHGSDADNRKSTDPTESYRHYIDIDIYPEFLANGRIPQTMDSLVAIHGTTFVTTNGVVPFAIISYTDSVKIYLQQHNWQYAMLKAADLGHYVGDAHNPLHNTRYYDGWSAFSNGIHSRYETGLINRDSAYLQYAYDPGSFVNNINNYAFNITYSSWSYVDSVYRADSIAHVAAGNTNSTLYYQTFWEQAGGFTNILFKNASLKLASLIYTAWVNAGSPLPTYINGGNENVTSFELKQNYPNPFNPATTINFNLKKDSYVKLAVYDAIGREAEVLISREMKTGEYKVNWNAAKFASGYYYYRLEAGDQSVTKKMILTK